jgi:hypothetical protein
MAAPIIAPRRISRERAGSPRWLALTLIDMTHQQAK